MSLPVLVVVVTIGIAMVIAAVHFTGGTRAVVLREEGEARRRFADDFPDEHVEEIRFTRARRSAFLRLRGGRVGIVQGIGGHFLTRIVAPEEVVRMSRSDPETLSIRLRDFTWPGGDFRFASEADALAVMGMLDQQQGQEEKA